MSYDHQEIGDFANERDAQDWAERNNLDVRDLHYRSRGSRGVILRDKDGVCWRLGFVDEAIADGLSGRVRVRGRIVEVDRIEVEYVQPIP